MLSRELLELITETDTGKSVFGDPTLTKTYVTVFADKLPIGMSEAYQAHAQGIKPEYKFKVRYIEYSGQQKARYPVTTGKEYDLTRNYTEDDEWIELTLKGVVVNGDA